MAINGSSREFQLFQNKYRTSSDCYVFINGELLTEIDAIEYQIQENVNPIYGYASYTYDTLAVGSRLVNGRIAINYTTPDYLMNLLSAAKDQVTTKKTIENQLTAANINTAFKYGNADKKFNSKVKEQKNKFWGENGTSIKKYNSRGMTKDTFDIVINIGDEPIDPDNINNPDKLDNVIVLNNATLMSSGMKIQKGGLLKEVYSFVAQDAGNSINTFK